MGPYSQHDFKPRLTKHDFNDFSIGEKIDMQIWKLISAKILKYVERCAEFLR